MNNWRNMPGPGDPETWPACTGHPMDPRTPAEVPFDERSREAQLEILVERFTREELAEKYIKEVELNAKLMSRLAKARGDRDRLADLMQRLIPLLDLDDLHSVMSIFSTETSSVIEEVRDTLARLKA